MSLVGLVVAVVFLVAVPGWLLVAAAFPPRASRITWIERAYFSLAAGAFLLLLDGVVLGLLPHSGNHGSFETLGTGAPTVELSMLALSAVAFYVGLLRGAYPWISARFPGLQAPMARAQESR